MQNRLLRNQQHLPVVSVTVTASRQSSIKSYIEHLHQKQLSEWMELEFQGAIIRQEAFDMQCSREIYKNNSLADKLVKFVTKARLQIAETNTFLHLCYPHSYQKRCPRCNNPSETISHVLNGCMEFKNLYVARHNRIVKLIGEQIAADKLYFKILCDKIVKPEMFVNESEISDQSFSFQWVNHRRPDLLLVNKVKKKAFIVEFSSL